MKFGENSYLTSDKVFGAGTIILLRRDGGHYVFSLFPPTDMDNKLASAALFNPDVCLKKESCMYKLPMFQMKKTLLHT